jgi:hypothetical protein
MWIIYLTPWATNLYLYKHWCTSLNSVHILFFDFLQKILPQLIVHNDQGHWKLIRDNLKVVWAKYSTKLGLIVVVFWHVRAFGHFYKPFWCNLSMGVLCMLLANIFYPILMFVINNWILLGALPRLTSIVKWCFWF